MNATFLDDQGRQQPFLMGCYGLGITRTVAAGEKFKVWAANRPIVESQMNTLNYTVTVKIP